MPMNELAKPTTAHAALNPPLVHWQILANRLLLKYVTTHLAARPRAWGDFAPYGADPNAYPQAESTRIAVHHKNLFAQSLAGMSEKPHPDIVAELWQLTVQNFEAEIRAFLAVQASCP